MSTNIFEDFDEQSQEELQGYNFISLEDLQLGIIGADPFESIRTDKSAREISNEYALSTPLGKRSAFYKSNIVREDISLADFKVNIRVFVEDDLSLVREKYNKESVAESVIKLYIVVKDESLIKKGKQEDIRNANIRVSNIEEITGVVLGNRIFKLFNDFPERIAWYINRITEDIIEDDYQLEFVKKVLEEKFDIAMRDKRSVLFPLSLVGQLIQQELKKDLQQFWKPILTGIAKEVRGLKINDEKYWQPYTPEGKFKASKDFTPLIGKGFVDAESNIQKFIEPFTEIDKLLHGYLDLSKIGNDNKFKNHSYNAKLKTALAQIYNLFKGILKDFKDGLFNFINKVADKLYQLNAFLVGIINGAIEFVASLFDLMGLLTGLLSGDAHILWQAVKKEFKDLKEKGAIKYLFEALGKFFAKINKRYNTKQSQYQTLKNLGEDLFGIIEFVLGALAVVKVGKAVLKTAKETYDKFKKKVDDILAKRKKELDNPINKKTRKATQADIENLSKIRKRFNVGWKKNVASTKGKIGDDIIDLQSRSGQPKGTPENFDNFKIIAPENYNYKNGPEPHKINHTEQKQIEYLYDKYKNNKKVSGQIEIVSDLEICKNCEFIIDKFAKDFPNIEITKVWVRTELEP